MNEFYYSKDTADKDLKRAYEQGRAEGYSKAENDYFAQSKKDREDTYNCGYAIGRADAIDEYSNKLWQVIEKATVNCKFDFTIDDLHNLEIVIKGLAEEMKESKDELPDNTND